MEVRAPSLHMVVTGQRLVAALEGLPLLASVRVPRLEVQVLLIEAPLTPGGLENGYAGGYVMAGYVA